MVTSTSLFINRKFDCPIDELFTWVVTPELIVKWFGPSNYQVVDVTVDLTVGGSYKIELANPVGTRFVIGGNYLAIEKPNKLIFTFNYAGINNPPPNSIMEINLEALDFNSARLHLKQRFKTSTTDMKDRTKAWEAMFSKLAKLFADTI